MDKATNSLLSQILDEIDRKNISIIHCDRLADFPENLIYCCNREECIDLMSLDCEELQDLLLTGHCPFCSSHDWIVVGCIHFNNPVGALFIMHVEEKVARKIREKIGWDQVVR